MMQLRSVFCLNILTSLLLLGCAKPETFPSLGMNMAGPVALSKADNGEFFFVLNSDYERLYDTGSLLVLKQDGTKVGAINVPRLGRSLTVAGNHMILTFDSVDEKTKAQVWILDISDPEALVKAGTPAKKYVKEIDCTPINAAARADYEYFAVTCSGGRLWLGSFASDIEASTLTVVRDYGRTRRALYLDPKRGLLLAFPTDMSSQISQDAKLQDMETYSDTYQKSAGANEVPDDYEKDKRSFRGTRGRRTDYQFIVYDIAAQKAKNFPFLSVDDTHDRSAAEELRWLYFSLSSPEGWPDDKNIGILNPNLKNYRSNIWEALPNPRDQNSFFISHRGFRGSENSNNIVKVSIIGNIKDRTLPTSEVLGFERVYGFGGEVTDKSFPSDFDLAEVNGQQLLVINHFRDLVNWKPEERRFAIEAKSLDGGFWLSKNFESVDHRRSYYQVVVNNKGRGMTLSYYGNSVVIFDVMPGKDIQEVATIQ